MHLHSGFLLVSHVHSNERNCTTQTNLPNNFANTIFVAANVDGGTAETLPQRGKKRNLSDEALE